MMFNPEDDDAYKLSQGLSLSRPDSQASDAVSTQIYAASSKNHAQILRGIERVGQRALARAMGVNDSTITRMKENNHLMGSPIERTARMLAVLGYKLVPIEAVCFLPLED